MCMMLNDDIIKLLAQTKINKCLQFGYNNIRVKPIPDGELNPCGKCVFNKRNGCTGGKRRLKEKLEERPERNVNKWRLKRKSLRSLILGE